MTEALVILLLGINFLSFWKQDVILYVVSGVITMSVGVMWSDDYRLISWMVVGLGTYHLVTGVIEAVKLGGPARGMSQFRGVYNYIKGVFSK